MFRRMTRSAAARSAGYAAGIAEIQSLLAGTDPAAAEPTAADTARLSLLSEQVAAARETPGHGRTWWPARQYRRHRKIVITSIAVPAVLAGTAAGWVIAASPSPSQLTNAVVCYSLPHPPENGVSGLAEAMRRAVKRVDVVRGARPTLARVWVALRRPAL
jgi:hypothetical protein